MDERWQRLAERLNEAQVRQAPPATDPTALAARDELVQRLRELGQALDTVQVSEADGALTWQTQLRRVVFSPAGAEVKVAWSEPAPRQGRLYREAALGDRWVLVVQSALAEERVPLMDQGLLRLTVRGLGLEAPGADEAPTEAAGVESPPAPPRAGRDL